MDTPKVIERLRKVRTELSQKELAENLGMSLSSYQRMKDGAMPVTLEVIQKAAKFFNVSEDVLLGRTSIFNEDEMQRENENDQTKFTTMITVTLDGSKGTLDQWIRRLTAINAVI